MNIEELVKLQLSKASLTETAQRLITSNNKMTKAKEVLQQSAERLQECLKTLEQKK